MSNSPMIWFDRNGAIILPVLIKILIIIYYGDYAAMNSEDEQKKVESETIQNLREAITRLQEIAANPETSKPLKNRCLKQIKDAEKFISSIKTGELNSKTEFCEYCGEAYNPKATILHGDNHLLLTTKRYDRKTGQLIKQ